MKTRDYSMLLALADADLHGLGIARAVQELSDGETKVKSGAAGNRSGHPGQSVPLYRPNRVPTSTMVGNSTA